ncbi:MAG: zinc ABC transporter substrate-binding protein, partial [Actinomycetota bacterium]|nr:zinc ABC transporter substrate-binding protein [Actinomycetota bacterium]
SHAENEHVWYDFGTVNGVAQNVAEQLTALAPEKQAEFTANVNTLSEKLDALATKASQIGKAKPGAKIIATEPVAGYLLETAGLTDATPHEFAEAVEEETDPSAAAVAETNELVTRKAVIGVIYNEQTETPATKALKDSAAAAGVPVVGISETLPEGTTDYVEWMTKQVEALTVALSA